MGEGRDIYFFSPPTFEPWDWRNPDTQGIGGSETAQIEMAWRLARRGHRVTCYAPIPGDCPREWRGTIWKHCDEADVDAPGLWVISRCPELLDHLGKPGQEAWLVCQDEDYVRLDPNKGYQVSRWTPERIARLSRVIALCAAQGHQFLARYPAMADKVCVGSNGLKPELVDRVLKEGHTRNPLRLMYASSPDRALIPLLNIFGRVREFVPEAELHIAYGFDNIEKIVAKVLGEGTQGDPRNAKFLASVAALKRRLEGPGIVWHGRLNQEQLYREWAKTGLWVYPCSRFRETSCITCMEAQALGAVPVFSPLWAVEENCKFGVAVDGDHEDGMTVARFVQAVVALMQDPAKQEALRPAMMDYARRTFSWERYCDQYEAWMYGYANGRRATEQQHAFHLRWRQGRVLNVGCNDDAGELGEFGVNVDVMRGQDPWTGREVRPDLQCDARRLPVGMGRAFDTVALSDVLEHFEDKGAVEALREAARCLRPGGRITVTVPEDYSDPTGRKDFTPGQQYADGVYAYHWRPCTAQIVRKWFAEAGIREVFYRPIDYGFAWGHGFVGEVG